MIAENRVMPAFDIQIRIIAGPKERVNDFGPVALTQAGKAMLRYARMAKAIDLEQLTVDEGILGVHMKDPRAELVNVSDRIDQLADEMAGVPFHAEILTVAFIEEPLPHRRLRQHIEAHDRQVIRRHRTMLEGDADAFIGGNFCDRLPKLEQARQKILEGLIDWVLSFGMGFKFDHGAGKTSDGLDAQTRRDVDRSLENTARILALRWIERV